MAVNLAASNTNALTAAKFLIYRSFSLTEIESLCFELSVDPEQIVGDTKERKAENLIEYCERRGRFAELISLCMQKRPKEPWTAVLELRDKYEARHPPQDPNS